MKKFYELSGWDKVPLAIAGEAVAKCYGLATSKKQREVKTMRHEDYNDIDYYFEQLRYKLQNIKDVSSKQEAYCVTLKDNRGFPYRFYFISGLGLDKLQALIDKHNKDWELEGSLEQESSHDNPIMTGCCGWDEQVVLEGSSEPEGMSEVDDLVVWDDDNYFLYSMSSGSYHSIDVKKTQELWGADNDVDYLPLNEQFFFWSHWGGSNFRAVTKDV